MRGGRGNIPLGESWVVEGDDESEEYLPPNEIEQDQRARNITPRRSNRAPRSPDTEFVMPPLDQDTETLASSWSENTNRSPQRLQEPRRRIPRQTRNNGGQEKQTRTSTTQSISTPTSSSAASSTIKDFISVILDHTTMVLVWLIEILGYALKLLKTPLSYLVAIFFLFGLGLVTRQIFTSLVYTSLSPICHLPGSSMLNLPFCSVGHTNDNGPPLPVEFEQLMNVQSKFEDVLAESAGGVSLPLDMKQGEAYLRDLRQLVRYSQLKSRHELALELDGFIETARIASWDLTRFNSHVGRAVDSVIAISRFTSRVLDGIQEQETSHGALVAIFAPFRAARFTKDMVLEQYIKHAGAVEEEIGKLIIDAQALLMVLSNLEDRLDVIGGIGVRDGLHAQEMKDEILSQFWAILGGHRGKINKLNGQLDLLKKVEYSRKTAFAHVSGTLLKLQEMGSGLEDLRERVALPELLRDKSNIPLSVHIESIQRGVERLEEQRLIARRSQTDALQQRTNRVDMEGTLLDG